MGTAAYRLKISPRADVHDVFHVSKQMVFQSKLFQLLLSPKLIKDQPHIPMEVQDHRHCCQVHGCIHKKFLFIGVMAQMQKLGKTVMVSLFVFLRLHLGYKVPPWGDKLLQQ